MDDDAVTQFAGITGSTSSVATQYLNLSEGNLEAAIQLYFENDGIDLAGQADAVAASAAATSSRPPQPMISSDPPQRAASRPTAGRVTSDGVVHIDSDDDDEIVGNVGKTEAVAIRRDRPTETPQTHSNVTSHDPMPSTPPNLQAVMDDAEMARQMQEELYRDGFGGGGDAGAFGSGAGDDVRAPIARTTETLVGPEAGLADHGMAVDLRAAVEAQMAARRRLAPGRPGIFNQQATGPSVWDEEPSESSERRRALAQATGGASEASTKASLLAEMYRPPHEILSRLPWDDARDAGKAEEKWILVNVQDPSLFDCQVLNRDIWKNAEIKATIKESFIFMQYNKGDPRGAQYVQFYFKDQDNQDAYPHIAIVDPRTGEQVKVWSGPPVPKPLDYLMQLHEFLDRYSLKANARNPVATRKAEPKKKKIDVTRMTEEEMLELAMQNSLGNTAPDRHPSDDDPDALTRSGDEGKGKGKGKARADDEEMTDVESEPASNGNASNLSPSTSHTTSPFALISSTTPQAEPDPNPQTTTRIQFRHSGGRIIRRFSLSDPVRRLYEWLKSDPVEGKAGVQFEMVCMGKNLMDCLEESVEGAGLKNQTVMVEFVED